MLARFSHSFCCVEELLCWSAFASIDALDEKNSIRGFILHVLFYFQYPCHNPASHGEQKSNRLSKASACATWWWNPQRQLGDGITEYAQRLCWNVPAWVRKSQLYTWRGCFRSTCSSQKLDPFAIYMQFAVPRSWLNWLGAGGAPRAAGAGGASTHRSVGGGAPPPATERPRVAAESGGGGGGGEEPVKGTAGGPRISMMPQRLPDSPASRYWKNNSFMIHDRCHSHHGVSTNQSFVLTGSDEVMWSFWFDCTFPWYLASCVEQRTMSSCHQCYAATVDVWQMRILVAVLTSSSSIALIGIWMARHPGFVVPVGYNGGFIGLVQPHLSEVPKWEVFFSLFVQYMKDFWECLKDICLKDKIVLFESTTCPSFCRHGTGRHLLVFNKPLASGHLKDIKMSRFEGRFPFASRVYSLFTLKHSLQKLPEANIWSNQRRRMARRFFARLSFSATPRIWSCLVFCFFAVWKPLHHEQHGSNPRYLLSMLDRHKAC